MKMQCLSTEMKRNAEVINYESMAIMSITIQYINRLAIGVMAACTAHGCNSEKAGVICWRRNGISMPSSAAGAMA